MDFIHIGFINKNSPESSQCCPINDDLMPGIFGKRYQNRRLGSSLIQLQLKNNSCEYASQPNEQQAIGTTFSIRHILNAYTIHLRSNANIHKQR